MTAVNALDPTTLRVLSVEDEKKTILGHLDSLSFDGYEVQWEPDTPSAEARLRKVPFNFLILDQRFPGSDGSIDLEAGSSLVRRLKSGKLGEVNINVPFVFVTGSYEWVKESEMVKLPGYRGILVKASGVTTKLRAYCAQELRRTDAAAYRDRVLVRVEHCSADGLEVVIPSWSLSERVHVRLEELPEEMRVSNLEGARLFARMNLSVSSSEEIRLERWELADPPSIEQ